MSRPIEIGDLVEIQEDTTYTFYIITAVSPITIVPLEAPTQLMVLIPSGDMYQMVGLHRPHMISFRPAHFLTPESYRLSIIAPGKDREVSPFNGMTQDQILAAPFVGILHGTTIEGLKSIIRSGKIDHRLSLNRQGVLVGTGFGAGYEKKALQSSAYNQHQFPGVYTNIGTQHFFQTLHSGRGLPFIFIILSLALLQQQNWHYNTRDQYGIINNMTFSPQTLPQYVDRIDRFWGEIRDLLPELVFHDAVPNYFIEAIIVSSEAQRKNVTGVVGTTIPILMRSPENNKILSQARFIKGLNDFGHLSPQPPQYCYTGVDGNKIGEIVGPALVRSFDEDFNPYTQDQKEAPIDPDENAYVWQKRLDLCGIPDPYSPEREPELFRDLEDRMQAIYFEDRPRTPVRDVNRPPWKYTPEYYRV